MATGEHGLKWRVETVAEAQEREWGWHKWFAWHPVIVKDGEKVWLEVVERQFYPLVWDRPDIRLCRYRLLQ